MGAVTMPAPRKYSLETRERAIRRVTDAREADRKLSLNAATSRVGRASGINPDTLRGWCRQAEIDAGIRTGTPSSAAGRIRELEAQVRELQQAHAIQVVVAHHLARELTTANDLAAEIIDENRDMFGVAPMIDALSENGFKIASSTYYAARSRPPSARSQRDAELVVKIREAFLDPKRGGGVSGARRIWRLLNADGITVARCTVERLMRQEGLAGRPARHQTTR
jgi:putative transposase